MKIKNVEKLKEQLPWGAMTEIAKNVGVSVDTVSKVLSQKFENEEVLLATIRFLKSRKKKVSSLSSEIESLTASPRQ